MNPFASMLVTRDIEGEGRRRVDAEVRALYSRPDALPLPPEPFRPGLIARIAARLPILRRVVAGRA
jgi:hypothetical protein